MKHKLKWLSLGIAFLLPSLISSNSAYAVEVKTLFRIPYVSFSVNLRTIKEPVRDKDGNVVKDAQGNVVFQDKTDKDGNPITTWEIDPPPVNGITKIGFDFSFDPSKLQILTEPSTFGFLCNFSLEDICPSNNDPAIDPVPYGSPLTGSSWSFNVDNSLGRAIFAYDFSSTPVDITTNTNFFAFQTVSLNGTALSESDIVQNYTSSQQYCKTTISAPEPFSNNCGEPVPVPEPNSILGLLAFGTLGAGATLKRKLKLSKSLEKEIEKVS